MMVDEQKITSDDLFKISASLSLIGDGLALLALKKAEEESNNQKAISAAINRLIRKRP
ncbi:hypothetical protein SAMN04487969_101630 [Paenibacillus algorifonticola]|uniref:Uncharacterized protein n=1 Tax=Paenibacillus algorifonticola TaxID=684063 RepID=A0A1I1YM47_9BACL|nr:hypothetical protein [Paenibacillus algorifonticola]SFE20479.1 hypothetical protein SAMN04487969_101630 [Paenibacillus algorifonticola]